jgi:glycosyltransferase involved in cell wall biosynthesis
VEFTLLWRYTEIFPGVPTLLNAQNVEAQIIHQLGAACSNPLKRLLYRMEEARLVTEEVRAWRECTACCAVSDRERDVIAAASGNAAKVRTVANGVDLQRFAYTPKKEGDGTLILLGSMEYAPNLDAATWFMAEIAPLLKEQFPAVQLNLVGREVGRVPLPSGSASVQLHENVPDVRPWMYAADLLAVPLRMGAGTRIKILEAMAAGVPIVTTAKGCEGIAVRDGEHLLIADTPAEFARAAARLLSDRGMALHLAANARRLVEESYGWGAVAAGMEQV